MAIFPRRQGQRPSQAGIRVYVKETRGTRRANSIGTSVALRARWKRSRDSMLIFPIARHPERKDDGADKPDAHLLEMCKAVARRAKLN